MRKHQQSTSQKLPLNIELEKAVLCGIINGEVSVDKVHPDELSKEGTYVYKAVKEFDTTKAIGFKSIYFHATEVLGADPEEFRDFLKSVERSGVPQVEAVLDLLARKTIINDLVNEASNQIASG